MNRYYPDWDRDEVVAYLNGGCQTERAASPSQCQYCRPSQTACGFVSLVGPAGPAGPQGEMGPPGPKAEIVPGAAVASLCGDSTLTDVIGTVNALLAALREAGVIAT